MELPLTATSFYGLMPVQATENLMQSNLKPCPIHQMGSEAKPITTAKKGNQNAKRQLFPSR